MNNQKGGITAEMINIDSYEPAFYPQNIKVNKFSSSCININISYAKLCVSNVVKNLNTKVFNLMS